MNGGLALAYIAAVLFIAVTLTVLSFSVRFGWHLKIRAAMKQKAKPVKEKPKPETLDEAARRVERELMESWDDAFDEFDRYHHRDE